jgi:hypothetical protein
MQPLAQLRQGRIRLIFHQLPQPFLSARPDRRSRTSTTLFGGDRPCCPTLAQHFVHEPPAHAEAIRNFLPCLNPFITRCTNPLAKIQGVGFHATSCCFHLNPKTCVQ